MNDRSHLQTLPSPTAYPIVASINVILESQASLTSPEASSGGWENWELALLEGLSAPASLAFLPPPGGSRNPAISLSSPVGGSVNVAYKRKEAYFILS